jgi:hypothetical protein
MPLIPFGMGEDDCFGELVIIVDDVSVGYEQ